ncbi:MAG: ATP-binding cassette domain-containing protein, partial [Acidobacteriota bacterium]
MSHSGRAMLQWRGAVRRYGETVAVAGLDLRVERGEVLGLLGPNGAGKTTSIAMAVGLLAPSEGAVELEGGQNPLDPETRRR